MPKDEFDFDDPMELTGVGLLCEEDTSEAMAECFIEEFMRLGYNHKQLFALFRNPHYLGMNLVLEQRGESFVRDKIAEVFARWGRPCVWKNHESRPGVPPALGAASDESNGQATTGPRRRDVCSTRDVAHENDNSAPAEQSIPLDASATDPLGAAIPKLL